MPDFLCAKSSQISLFTTSRGTLPAYPTEQSYSFTLSSTSSRRSLFMSYTTGDEKPVHPIESVYSTSPVLPLSIICMDPALLGHSPLLTNVKKSGTSSSVKNPAAKLLL